MATQETYFKPQIKYVKSRIELGPPGASSRPPDPLPHKSGPPPPIFASQGFSVYMGSGVERKRLACFEQHLSCLLGIRIIGIGIQIFFLTKNRELRGRLQCLALFLDNLKLQLIIFKNGMFQTQQLKCRFVCSLKDNNVDRLHRM